jgi:hypothetical protein
VVLVSWSDRGRHRQLRADGMRSPDAQELANVLLRMTSVEPATRTVRLNAEGRNATAFTLHATTALTRGSVAITYPRLDGPAINANMAGVGGRIWSYTLPQNQYRFPNGRVTFTATTEPPPPDSGYTNPPATDSIVFLRDLALTSLSADTADGAIHVCGGALAGPLTLPLHITGSWTPSDDALVSWAPPLGGRPEAAGSAEAEPTVEDGTGHGYRLELAAGTPLDPGVTRFSVALQRARDGQQLLPGSAFRDLSVIEDCSPAAEPAP